MKDGFAIGNIFDRKYPHIPSEILHTASAILHFPTGSFLDRKGDADSAAPPLTFVYLAPKMQSEIEVSSAMWLMARAKIGATESCLILVPA